MRVNNILVLLVFYSLLGCETQIEIEGLWLVDKVFVGDKEMTPNARWTRFNKDNTQQSGNGWYQHSYGTYKFNTDDNSLTIINENGLDDTFDGFKVELSKEAMWWTRIEEGMEIKVLLRKSDELPKSFGDKILGLWELEKHSGSSNIIGDKNGDYVFFRWDRRFVMTTPKGKVNGVYNVHGHKSEVELIPYGENLDRTFWNFHSENNSLILELLNSDSIVKREFKRIRRFP